MAGNAANQVYLDIHVGGIVRTQDSGITWEAINHGLEEDVHQVATHPLRPDRVYAATADGFYLSENAGATWHRRNTGMPNLYCRGVAVHPNNPDIVLLSGSPDPPPGWGSDGPRFVLFRTESAGTTWQAIAEGFPNPSPDVIDTSCIAFSKKQGDLVLCGLRSGELYGSDDAGNTWTKRLKLKELNSVCWGG
jgi:photosystem II stability/assembly factor-like uncharacterized protein